MKSSWIIPLMMSALVLSGCGGKKAAAPVDNAISSQYTLSTFNDINNPSTYNPELLKDYPRKMDFKSIMTSVKDQGERGTCSFFGTIAITEAAIKEKMKVDVNLSEEFLNYSTKARGYLPDDEGSNAYLNQLAAFIKKDGFLLEKDWPYQPTWFEYKSPCEEFTSTDTNAPAICFSHGKPPEEILAKKISSDNFQSDILQADDFNDVIKMIAIEKHPVTIGIPVHMDGMKDSGDIQYTEEMRNECVAGSNKCGGHLVVITGYDLDKEIFFFKNSWGTKWGQGGYGTMPFSIVDRHTNQRFGMVVLKDKISLPKDYNVDYLKLKKFEINSTELSDGTIDIKTSGSMEKLSNHAIIIHSVLTKRKDYDRNTLSELNTEDLLLSDEDVEKYHRTKVQTANYVLMEQPVDQLNWKYDDTYQVKLSALKMNYPSVLKIRKNRNEQLAVKTTLSVYTDEDQFRPLKVIVHSLDFLSIDL